MPLPWKKHKVTRISRIVADLQSPKRGGSLVVETGFPTSLIDLFVKNRDKLKKPSIKKKKKKNKAHQNDTEQPENDAGEDLRAADPEPICENTAPSESVEEEEETEVVLSGTHEYQSQSQSRVVVFLSVVIKVFAVVVLALGTRKLTVGITLSAFVLLFLEYFGKRLILCFLESFRCKKQGKESVDGQEQPRSAVEEIEVVETNNDGENDTGVSDEEIDKKWGFSDMKEDCGGEFLVAEKSKSKSKKAKIRSKIIKKFVPKKLRSTIKGKKYSKEEDKIDRIVEEHYQQELEQGSDEQDIVVVVEEEEDEEEEAKEGRFDKLDNRNEVEEQEQERKGIYWIYMSLVLIVLLGLLGGRVVALPLTIAWCFVLKRIGKQRKSALIISS